jgi:hypothetical protein
MINASIRHPIPRALHLRHRLGEIFFPSIVPFGCSSVASVNCLYPQDSGYEMKTTKIRVTTPVPGKEPLVWHFNLMTGNPAEAIRWAKATPQVLPSAIVEVVGAST